ncbi:MAG TPA: alpha-amylase family glycosyl hydrolase [Saprospiraceae bacterium]|nr:alpha-amylase family glycosyl hydrolase [Saprospiraceae bacterium]
MQESQPDQYLLDEGTEDHKLIIYQLLIRLFSNTNTNNRPWGTIAENGVGKFNDITLDVLDALKDFGMSHIWYTGVLEHATMTDYTAYGIRADEPTIVKGRAGSPYAIKDYFDVDPDLAGSVPHRMAEFEALIERTHQVGLQVIIDFVPNHLARQYYSDQSPADVEPFGKKDEIEQAFHPQNNFYYLPGQSLQLPDNLLDRRPDHAPPKGDKDFVERPAKATGNDVFHARPSINDWYETIKLNYGVDYMNGAQQYFDPIPDTWLKMRRVLQFWLEKGIDGFRCDMAEMVPVEFWAWVIPQIKAINPQVVFIAEIYKEQRYREYLEQGCFDYLYDKVQLYDTLKKVVRQQGSTDWLTGIWQYLRGINKNMLRFLENHDEQRVASPDFAPDPWHALPAMVLSATWHNGPVMIYFGQEVGEPGAGHSGFSGDDGRTTIFDYWGVPLHQQWYNHGACDGAQLPENRRHLRAYYRELLQLCNTEEAIRRGQFYDLQEHNRRGEGYGDQVLTYLRFTEEECLLFVLNFSVEVSQFCKVNIPEHLLRSLGLERNFTWEGIFGTQEKWLYQEQIDLILPPLASFILKVRI